VNEKNKQDKEQEIGNIGRKKVGAKELKILQRQKAIKLMDEKENISRKQKKNALKRMMKSKRE